MTVQEEMFNIRIGAKLPSSGPLARQVDLRYSAVMAEEVGFDSLWVSDHVIMVRNPASSYPLSPDGRMTWDPEDLWYDALVALATVSAVTHRIELGVAALIAAIRNPVVLAKQLSSLDALSGGRVSVGVGAGWLAEEFEVLGTPFEARGEILDEWIEICRDCWTGTPKSLDYRHYHMPEGVLCYPTPVHEIPILIGGMSEHALRRVARRGDGWLAIAHVETFDVGVLAAGSEKIRVEAAIVDRPAPRRVVIRMPGPAKQVAQHLTALAGVGVTDVIVDVDWIGSDGPHRTLEILRASLPRSGHTESRRD